MIVKDKKLLLKLLEQFEAFVDEQPPFTPTDSEIMQACLRVVAGYEDTERQNERR